MTQTEIDALSGTEFTTGEVSRCKRICLDQPFVEIKKRMEDWLTLVDADDEPIADNLQSERKMMRSHLLVFFDEFLDGTIAVKGGKRGTDFSNVRDKEDLRREVRRMLGLPLVSPEILELEQTQRYGPRRVSQSVYTKRVY